MNEVMISCISPIGEHRLWQDWNSEHPTVTKSAKGSKQRMICFTFWSYKHLTHHLFKFRQRTTQTSNSVVLFLSNWKLPNIQEMNMPTVFVSGNLLLVLWDNSGISSIKPSMFSLETFIIALVTKIVRNEFKNGCDLTGVIWSWKSHQGQILVTALNWIFPWSIGWLKHGTISLPLMILVVEVEANSPYP